MKILITQKQMLDKHHQALDSLESNYVSYFLKENIFDCDTVFVPVINNVAHAEKLTEHFKPDLIIFTGGNNVEPLSADEKKGLDDFCPERDKTERFLIDFADNNNIFKLAICRGFQFINICYGGKLTYHLQDHPPKPHLCIYENLEYTINSYHNHGIKKEELSSQLVPVVLSKPDNLVEAYIATSTASPMLGVQWHPERDKFPTDLFKILWQRYYK